MSQDRELIAQILRSVEKKSRGLSWAKERPWKTATHVQTEAGVPVLDLHDLGQALALDSVRKVLANVSNLTAGAVVFVTGSGQNSLGGRAVLKPAVQDALLRAAEVNGWTMNPRGNARLVLVYDAEAAPASVSGALGPGFWLPALLFLGAAIAAAIWG